MSLEDIMSKKSNYVPTVVRTFSFNGAHGPGYLVVIAGGKECGIGWSFSNGHPPGRGRNHASLGEALGRAEKQWVCGPRGSRDDYTKAMEAYESYRRSY